MGLSQSLQNTQQWLGQHSLSQPTFRNRPTSSLTVMLAGSVPATTKGECGAWIEFRLPHPGHVFHSLEQFSSHLSVVFCNLGPSKWCSGCMEALQANSWPPELLVQCRDQGVVCGAGDIRAPLDCPGSPGCTQQFSGGDHVVSGIEPEQGRCWVCAKTMQCPASSSLRFIYNQTIGRASMSPFSSITHFSIDIHLLAYNFLLKQRLQQFIFPPMQ